MIAPVQPWRWIRLELGLILNGGIQYALFIDSPLFWPSLGLTSGLILLLQLWPSSTRGSLSARPQSGDGHAAYWRGVAGHVCALLPLWAGHIALGREQIDNAASQLTYRFDSILHHLGHTPASAPTSDEPYALSAAETRLTHMLELLQQPQAQREQLAKHLQQLRQTCQQLAEQAHAVTTAPAAGSTPPLLALVQTLQQQLETLDNDIDLKHTAQDAASRGGVQTPFDLPATVEDILVHLQFQDRVSQILSNVQNDIWRLETTLHEALHSHDTLPEPPDTQAWLTALKNSYTTHEQQALHNRDHSSKTPGPSDITFF